jgi:Holliday junction resolvase RusA-like endonuclease
MRESSKKVKPWRRAVADAAETALWQHPNPAWFPLDGPLVALMVFTLPAPQTKKADEAPNAADRTPDVSKLCRATEDALTKTVWKDDARIIGYDRLWKTYPGCDPLALSAPGAHIAVRRATHADLCLDPESKDGRKYTALLDRWASLTAADRRADLLKGLLG